MRLYLFAPFLDAVLGNTAADGTWAQQMSFHVLCCLNTKQEL